jgi:hypothetical protein
MKRLLITREDFVGRFGLVPDDDDAGVLLGLDTGELHAYLFVSPDRLKPESAVWLDPDNQTLGWTYPPEAVRDIQELHRMLALGEDN